MELLIVSIMMVAAVYANLFLWREVRRLRAENKGLREQRTLLAKVFESVATDWAVLLDRAADQARRITDDVGVGRDDANSTTE